MIHQSKSCWRRSWSSCCCNRVEATGAEAVQKIGKIVLQKQLNRTNTYLTLFVTLTLIYWLLYGKLRTFSFWSFVSVVGAIEQQTPHTLNVGFVIQTNLLSGLKKLQLIRFFVGRDLFWDFYWRAWCYREINLSPSQAWQTYQFVAIRKACLPSLLTISSSIAYSLRLKCKSWFRSVYAALKWANLYLGLTAVLKTKGSTMQCSIVDKMLIFTINATSVLKIKKREIDSRFFIWS